MVRKGLIVEGNPIAAAADKTKTRPRLMWGRMGGLPCGTVA
jgi:hypothetical protein